MKAEDVKNGQRVMMRNNGTEHYGNIIGGVFIVPAGKQGNIWRDAVWVQWDGIEHPRTCPIDILEPLEIQKHA